MENAFESSILPSNPPAKSENVQGEIRVTKKENIGLSQIDETIS